MKFTCNQNSLVKALNIVSKAVTARTTIPILKGILLNVDENGILTMAASDLDISIENKIKVDNFEPGEIVVQSKLFGDIIRKLPNDLVNINESSGNISIKCSNSEFNIVGNQSDEFPKVKLHNEASEKYSFEKEFLKEMIRKTSFAASIDESRGTITGILIEIKENSLNFVALDGFRMAVLREECKNNSDQNIIISAKLLNELAKISQESDDASDITMSMADKRAVFKIGENISVVLRLLDGDFVAYEKILPKNNNKKIVLNKTDLLESIERASLLAKIGKNNLIILSIKDNIMEITSKSEEGNVREEVIISNDANELVIGFNSKYLIDVLKVIDDESIAMYFDTSVSPLLIKPLSGNQYEYLVLPVRITN